MSFQIPQPQSAPLGLFRETVALLSSLKALEKKLEETIRERDALRWRCQDLEEEINDLLDVPDTWFVCHLARQRSLKASP